MKLAIERSHNKYGSTVFARRDLKILSIDYTDHNDIEILTIELTNCTITSIYKPPCIPFQFTKPKNFDHQNTQIAIGDFSSHSEAWGYADTNDDGVAVEKWSEDNDLSLIHDPKLLYSFNIGRWKRGYNPDIIFVSKNIRQQAIKYFNKPIPHSQHHPISCKVLDRIRPFKVPFKRRFNFIKANWSAFSRNLDSELKSFPAYHTQYDSFIEIIKKVSRNHIPRGCRVNYILGLFPDQFKDYETYTALFNMNPFSVETFEKGERLMQTIAEAKRIHWHSLLNEIDSK
jgi:hypothetical protein